MGAEAEEEVEALLEQAAEAPHPEERWRLAREAARLAEFHALSPSLRYRASRRAFRGAVFSGRPSDATVYFGNLVAAFDADPRLTSGLEFLRDYSMAIGELVLLKIPRAQIEAALEDFAGRLEAAGFSRRAYHHLRWGLLRSMGLQAEAEEAYRASKGYARDALADCLACETDTAVGLALEDEDLAKAERLAAPLLAGDLRCGSRPAITYARFLRPYFFAERFEDAERCFRLGLPGVRASRAKIGWAADFLEYLAFLGDSERGVDLAREILELLPEVESRHCSFECYRVLAMWLEGCQDFSLPSPSVGAPAGSDRDPRLLQQWARERAAAVGDALDARNQTSRYAERALESDRLMSRAREIRP